MPELPEVEALRLGLVKSLINRKVVDIDILYPKIVCGKGTSRTVDSIIVERFKKLIIGNSFVSIKRRAKNLIIELSNGAIVLVHLKMTGQLVYMAQNCDPVSGGHPIEISTEKLPNKHTAIVFTLDDGKLFYNDVRKFGYVLCYENKQDFEKLDHFVGLGLEPLNESKSVHADFSFEKFTQNMKKQTGVLKKIFLEQKVVVGLGNIYSDEVCFAAGVMPDRKVESLKKFEIEALYNEIIRILPLAVNLGGSSIANYLLADGSRGNYAREHKVYQKSGQKCVKCKTILVKTQLAGRSTVHCPKCQK